MPELRSARLVSDVAQHFTDLAVFDFPKRLAAKLKIVSLVIDRPTAIAVDQNPIIHAAHEIIERDVFFGRLERHIRHAREGNAAPAIAMQAAVRFCFADQRRQIARRLPAHKQAIFHQRPTLGFHAFVIISYRRQTMGLRPIGVKIADARAEFEFAGLVRR